MKKLVAEGLKILILFLAAAGLFGLVISSFFQGIILQLAGNSFNAAIHYTLAGISAVVLLLVGYEILRIANTFDIISYLAKLR
ncbi:MAG: hypothetical protein J4224_02270 [Candidatus Diapherotrites archaeon]|uniref:Uncharacterized protein n=1 Tax=Candidatus Iainarchaeum sp. TaxID=3101447 RepID=A0A7J4ITL2_9ARCH|nr:MAG: hypothetical protein QT03_C0001G0382 [archaeon GW2011_AR10]MBS3059230.1 hypothetical protein [Candidatus Diapherotrites archaeon]HIH08792.1 hypothetical protein [Candidatus Diapherotrites archaeon]